MPRLLSGQSIYVGHPFRRAQLSFHDFDNSGKASSILSDLSDDLEHMATSEGAPKLLPAWVL